MQSHFLHWVALLQIFYSFDCEPMPALVLNFHTALQLFGDVRSGKLRYPVVNQKNTDEPLRHATSSGLEPRGACVFTALTNQPSIEYEA